MSEFITVKATISSVETQLLRYAACPLMFNGKPCNVKATCNGDGTWHCQRCGVSFKSCDYGFSVRIQIQDHTGTAFATAYEEAAKEIFGCTAKDLYTTKYKEQGYAQLNGIIHSVVCKQYVFQLRVKANPFSDGRCAECIVLKAVEVDPSAESRRLLGAINDMNLLPEGLGSCLESGSSMPTWCSSPSDLKGRSTIRFSNSSHAISPARSAVKGVCALQIYLLSGQTGTPQCLLHPHTQHLVSAGVVITVARGPALWTLADTDHPHLLMAPWAAGSTMLVAPRAGCMVLRCLPRLRLTHAANAVRRPLRTGLKSLEGDPESLERISEATAGGFILAWNESCVMEAIAVFPACDAKLLGQSLQ